MPKKWLYQQVSIGYQCTHFIHCKTLNWKGAVAVSDVADIHQKLDVFEDLGSVVIQVSWKAQVVAILTILFWSDEIFSLD